MKAGQNGMRKSARQLSIRTSFEIFIQNLYGIIFLQN